MKANNVYVGNRYVPVFTDPVNWDNIREYEPLTIVTYQGASYTSRKTVPAGIDISNTDYWALTGNYNAQVEQYRQQTAGVANSLASEIATRASADYMIKGGDLLCIGDSYLKGSNHTGTPIKSWGDYLADYMGKSLNTDYYKYFYGGCGFVTTVDGNKTAQCAVSVKQASTSPNYVLHGLYYGDSEWTDKPMVANPYSTTEYMIQGVNLYANDVFKVHMYGETWYGYSAIKSSVKSGLVTAAPSDDNIKVLATGVYDIYCDYNESDGGHIYLAKVDETSSTVSVSGISLSNTGKYLLVRNEFVITPTVYPNNATNKEVRWSSSDESIATVTSGGRVVAKEKRGSTTITAKTVDGNLTATCIVYVSPSQYPDYCLTGTVGGYTRSGISMRYAAIPLDTTGNYLIPDVNLIAGDELTVTNNQGARLRNKYNQIYTKPINENMSVNVYLNVNDANHDYLTFDNK